MGRGDKKTKRGKIFKGSYGKLRPSKNVNTPKPAAVSAVKEDDSVKEMVEVPKKRAVTKKSKPAGE